ncbi:transcriptional regulator ATRX homolog isoform X2 [Anopheles stephensi]|uniref:transcriptional regulator ATRX homolog isoform X2 n=1 Tax=Anopheles stephensi TaxID=30069 RepID=UPI0016588CEB|nr:transcriptional regulator ATRX homolog isoform X2 [Anopheles stephensi]
MKKSSNKRDKRKQQPTVPRSQRNRDDSGADVDYENDRMHVKKDSFDTVKSSSKVKSGDNPTPAGLLENGASIGSGSEPAVVAESTSPVAVEEKGSCSPTGRVDSPELETKQTIRLVSLDKLLRPSLVGIAANGEDASGKASKAQGKPSLGEKDKSVSIIELSDDSDEDVIQQFVVQKQSNRLEDGVEVVGTSTKSPVRSTSAKGTPANGGFAATPSMKELSIVVKRLPTNLTALKTAFGLSEIRDQYNRIIESFVSTTRTGSSDRKLTANDTAKKATNMANDQEQEQKQQKSKAGNSKREKQQQQQKQQENGSDGNGQSEEEETIRNDSESDAPIGRMRNKTKSTIPNERKNNRNTRKRRAVSDSEEDKGTGKPSVTTTNGGDSNEQSEASGSDQEFTKSNTATGRNRRAAERSKRAATTSKAAASDDGSGDSDDGKKAKADFQPRKKRTRIRRNSSSSDDDGRPAKRKRGRRLQKKKKSDGESDADSPNKGRKNIRKLLRKGDLEETTKNAEQEERERKQRIAERQKLYNQVYDEKPEVATTLDQLVLDFDEETKEPLLEVDKKLVKLLKPHQANGIKFMFDACFESLEQMKESKGCGCILAHCMGLGKSLQVVTLTHTLLANADLTGVERVLIVCPLSTVLNWANEYHMWMKHVQKGTEVEVYEISKYKDNVTRANKLMEWHNEGGVMIMGYDMFRNLANPTATRIRKKVRESLQTSLIDPGPELIVCDEGHLLKNEKTSLSQAVNRISTMRRIVLTGTPIQNNMKEYYCMVQFVKPKLLGTYNEYMNRFVNPITNGQYTDSTPYDIQLMRKRAHVLHKLLDGCVQRRDYSVLAPFLPPKLEFVVSIKLTPVQSTLYKYYMENLAGKRLADDPMQKRSSMLFNDFQNLQRIWTHPRVLRYNSDRYEIRQQRKRDLDSENESAGSMKDFIDDVSDEESAESTPASSDDDDSDVKSVHDDNSKSSGESSESKQKVGRTRSTRNNPGAGVLEDDVVIEKPENPTEWWMQMCPETELDKLEHSGKLIVLMEILKECEAIGDKLLVFSQSLYSLDVIEHFLALLDENMQKSEEERDEQLSKYPASWSMGLDYFRLDGSTSIDNRNDACKVFNDENNTRARLFLISTRAGGLGINLVAANRVVIFDVSWNPSHDIQSIFRVYRFGQNKPCYIYRFIAMGTMEEKIYERQVTKQAISKRVIDEQQIDRHYKENDLQELYRYEVEPGEPRPVPNLPKDRLFAELLQRFDPLIYKYHEHDSLLENKEEETLNEEERKAAWEEFELEKNRPPPLPYVGGTFGLGVGGMAGRGVNGPVTSSTTYGFRNDVLLKLLNLKAREDNPTFNDATINAMIPYMMQQLTMEMKEGELTMYRRLWDLYYKLEVPATAASQPYAAAYNALQPGMAVGPMPPQQPMMANVMGAGPNVPYQMNPNQTGVRPAFPPQFPIPQQEPGISGMHRSGNPVGVSSIVPGPAIAGAGTVVPIANRGPVTIDPNVVELD